MPSPTEVVQATLNNPLNLESVTELVAPEVTYVSFNYDNPELRKIMPWAGSRPRGAPAASTDIYSRVNRFWTNEGFENNENSAEGNKVAVFGCFTYPSITLSKGVTSSFSVFARVEEKRVAYMHLMEDTYATAASFRVRGEATYSPIPIKVR